MRLSASAILALCVQSVCAQSILKDPKELSVLLNEVVVTGTGTEHYLKDASVQTEVITGRTLDSYQGCSMQDILEGLSASITSNPSDMGSGIQMNGLGNDYILIPINGKRINGGTGRQNDLSIINPANIGRIEIIEGAASSLYDSDAIAGVINITTKKNRDKVSLSDTTRVGSHGDILGSVQIGFGYKRVNSTTSLSTTHTDGWRNTTQEWDHHEVMDGTVTRTVNRSTNFTLRKNLTYRVNDRLSLSADGSFYQKRNYRPHGAFKYYIYDQFYRNLDVAGGAKYTLGGLNFLSVDLTYGSYSCFCNYHHKGVTNFFDPETGLCITHYPREHILETSQQRFLGQAKSVFHLRENDTLSAGLEYQYDHLKSPRRIENGKASVFTASAYVQDEWNPTDQLNVTVGGRFVVHQEFGAMFTPKVSAMYELGDFNIRATYSNGFKAPTLKELYDDYITQIGGDPWEHYYDSKDLRPQKSSYYSASAEYHVSNLQITVTEFCNRIKNIIALTEIPTSAENRSDEIEANIQHKNLFRARPFGGDISPVYQILPSLAIGGGYNYTDVKAQYTDDPADPNHMFYIPINGTSFHNANWKLAWNHTWKKYKLGVTLFGRYQSTRFYITDGDGKSYQLWRLNIRHNVLKKKRWNPDINVGIDNIFDYVDRTPFGRHRGTTSPERAWYASFIVKSQNKHKL